MITEKIDILRFISESGLECRNIALLNNTFYQDPKKPKNRIADPNHTAINVEELIQGGYLKCPGHYNQGDDLRISITAAGRDAIYQHDLMRLSEKRARNAELRGYAALVISSISLLFSLLSFL